MPAEELQAAFKGRQNVLRNATLGADATITKSGFIDTSHGAAVTRSKSIEPSKVRLLRMSRARCVYRSRCAGDGPLKSVKQYLEYSRETFQLILL